MITVHIITSHLSILANSRIIPQNIWSFPVWILSQLVMSRRFHAKTDSQSWWIKTGEKFHTLNIIFYPHDGSDGATIGESWALGWVHTWFLHNSVYSAQYSFTIESPGKFSFLLVYKGSERCKSLAGVRMLPGSGMVPFVYKGSHIKWYPVLRFIYMNVYRNNQFRSAWLFSARLNWLALGYWTTA